VRIRGLSFKLESTNPTGSYKDRFVAAELERILGEGRRTCIATSSGNTGSSLAAYGARYGAQCVILVNADAPSGKLLQIQAHGAKLIHVAGFVTSPEVTEKVFAQLERFTCGGSAALIVSAFRYCPTGMRAVGKIASEIAAQHPSVKHVFVPVGGGGLFSAISEEMQRISPATRVHAVQPEGCPTLLDAVRTGRSVIAPVTSTTHISGLSVPFDIDAGRALKLLRQGGGIAIGVTDEQVYDAQRQLLRSEGIYPEPAGATAFAGYLHAVEHGLILTDDECVCIVTGHGFKDRASIEEAVNDVPGVSADADQLLELLAEMTR
jgi:threonine synthase